MRLIIGREISADNWAQFSSIVAASGSTTSTLLPTSSEAPMAMINGYGAYPGSILDEIDLARRHEPRGAFGKHLRLGSWT
jgi:hypothetical protein